MKKNLRLVLVLFVTIFFTACGNASKEVPEDEIMDHVETYYENNTMAGYLSREYDAVHSWNAETKTDTVQLKVITEYEYGFLIAECEQKYQYDRSSGLWNLKNSSQWAEYADYGDKLDGAVFSGTDEFGNINYTVNIESVDFETGEIIWNYDLKGTSSGYYSQIQIAKTVSGTLEMHPDDTYTVSTLGPYNKEVPYCSLSATFGSLVFGIDFTIRGPEYVYFWI